MVKRIFCQSKRDPRVVKDATGLKAGGIGQKSEGWKTIEIDQEIAMGLVQGWGSPQMSFPLCTVAAQRRRKEGP